MSLNMDTLSKGNKIVLK